MNAKKAIIILFGIASAGVWGPQAWSAYQESKVPEKQFPNANDVGIGALGKQPSSSDRAPSPAAEIRTLKREPVASIESTPKAALGAPAQAAPSDPTGQGSQGAQIQQLLGVLQSFTGSTEASLNDLLQTTPSWLQTESATQVAAPGDTPPNAQGEPSGQRRPSPLAAQNNRIQEFLSQAELTAIVSSDGGAWALLGGRIVRTGDVLVPKLLTIRSIQKHGLILESPMGPIDIQLPAFQVREPSSAPESEAPPATPAEVAAPVALPVAPLDPS